MAKVNENYLKLSGSYLFSTIAKKIREYEAAHPGAEILRLGIGDVTQPIAPAVIEALHGAVEEMGQAEAVLYVAELTLGSLDQLGAARQTAWQRPRLVLP